MKLQLLIFLITVAATMHAQEQADAIYVNGNVYRGAVMEKAADGSLKVRVLQRAQAIAVRGDRIVAVGMNADVEKVKGKKTQVVDLGGKFVMPGFNDAHVHFAAAGLEMLRVDVSGTKSLDEMLARIAERAKTTPPGEWIEGRGWDQTKWTDQRLPSRQDLDKVTAGHPAFFIRADGHIAVANSAALKFAGITKETKNSEGGSIDRDASGGPTGILRETAKEQLQVKMPQPSPSMRRRAIELTLAEAAKWGITSVQESPTFDDNSTDWPSFLTYEDLELEGKLTVRVSEWLPFNTPLATLEKHREHHAQTDAMLHTSMLKAYMDGSLGSRTAALLAPYSDDPKNSGLTRYEPVKLNQMARERVAAGFQLGFHAIGDRAAQMALDTFADAERFARENTNVPRRNDFRFRIEHAQVIEPAQFAEFRQLGVIASMQPNHLLTDMNWAESRIGPQRAKTSYAWREFLKNGVVVVFGTDFPVEPITPFRGLYAAVTRNNEAGTKEYFPEQKLTIDEAIAAYTSSAAYAEFAEREKGTLETGKLADFVVLDRDLTKVAPAEILGTRVVRTVVGGKTVASNE